MISTLAVVSVLTWGSAAGGPLVCADGSARIFDDDLRSLYHSGRSYVDFLGDYEEVGCFIERPPTLQTWILENNETISSDEIYEQKMEWYAQDSGQETLATFVSILEAAATGNTICG